MAIKIISETPITMAELKEDLKKIKERDEELNFRAQKTEEYLNLFVGLNPAQSKELAEKIDGLNIPRFKPEHTAKIIDTLPSSVEEAKSILSAYPITITNENLKKIVDVVLPYIELGKKEIKKQEAQLAKERKKAEEEEKARQQEEAEKEEPEQKETTGTEETKVQEEPKEEISEKGNEKEEEPESKEEIEERLESAEEEETPEESGEKKE